MKKELTEADLLDLKEQIENNKTKLAEAKGEEKLLLKQLNEKWGCKTLAEAKKKLEEMKKKQAVISTVIEDKTTELEEKYLNDSDDED